MLLWIAAACLTLGACFAVLMPALRARSAAEADKAFDLEVYQDQLAELDRDVARGVIQGAEAEQARAEIGRRILKLSAEAKADGAATPSRAGRMVISAAVLAVPLASWGIYAATGSPELPAQPLTARLAERAQQNPIDDLVARAESHLAANPQDGRGWDVLAPIYYRSGRYDDAATAYRNAIRLLGATAAREAGLGEAIAAANGGMINHEAEAAFDRAVAIEPANPKARFLLAAGLAQEGKADEAEAAWRALESELAADSPWREAVAQALAELRQTPGPSQEELEAAGLISDNDRAEMIETMVAGLDQRLRDNPQDPEGWQRLIHSYAVLGKADEARDALARGLEALGKGSEAGAALTTFSAARGVTVTE